MKLIDKIKEFRWGYLIAGLLLCGAGICFFAFPSESSKTGSYIIGAFTVLVGLIQIIRILADRKRGFSFSFSILASSLTVVCGAIAIIIPEKIAELYPMFIGLLIIIDGAFKLQTVISAKRYNLKMWWFLLLFSVLTIILGFMDVRIRTEELSNFNILFAFSLFADGLQNFFSLFFFGRIVYKAKTEIENSAKEIKEDYVVADSYIDNEEYKETILSPENVYNITPPGDSDKEKEKISKNNEK